MSSLFLAVWLAAILVPLMVETVKNGTNGNGMSGPTWKWLVGILISIVGIGFGGWMTSVWTQLNGLTDNVVTVKSTLVDINSKLGNDHEGVLKNSQQIVKLWEKYDADHESIVRQQIQNDTDHELLHNWVHPDHAGTK